VPEQSASEFDGDESEWMEYCVPEMMDKDDYEQDRAVASCMSMWSNRNETEVNEQKVEEYLEGNSEL
jgi:hypothetical protein